MADKEQSIRANLEKANCITPISISAASSSSEDEATILPLDSYHVIKRTSGVRDKPRSGEAIQIPKIDPFAILEIEEQAKVAAASLAGMTTYLSNELHKMSAMSSEAISLYGEAVNKAGLSVEHNVRIMYGLMAKCEELNRKMKPVYNIQTQIQDISQQLDILEASCK